MNNDFSRDNDGSAMPLNPDEVSPTAAPVNGASVNGASVNGANGMDAKIVEDSAMRDALEDAHALFVRPAQGQGVARGVSADAFNDAVSVAPIDYDSTDYDSNDAYHRAMGISNDDAATQNTTFASYNAPTAPIAPVDHLAENPEAEFLPSSMAIPAVAGSRGAIVPPSDDPPSTADVPDPAPHHDEESGQDIWEHLGELRSRILKCVVAVGLAMVATWQYRDALLGFFASPIVKVLKEHNGTLTIVNPMEGLSIYIQTTFTAALLLVLPFVLYQVWAFIEPALTHKERRYSGVLVPFSVLLFFVGVVFGFYLTPMFFEFFFQFQPPGTSAFWSYSSSATFLAKMLLVFGICFQVPVLTIFVNKIGLVSRNLLIEYWRHVVVVIFVLVAVITPTWDPLTMTAAALPPCILYGVSIWLVKWL